ncbi:MAG TPA: C2 family cysteine protease [Planctomycetota bacterium]
MAHHPDGLLVVPPKSAVVALSNPGTSKLQTHFKQSGKLFPTIPSVDDVVQGNLGDCYFLAAVLAVLESPDGPEIIETLMKDNLNGTVTVRLFKKAEGQFHYLSVDKSLVYEFFSTKVLHATGALWLGILEKAFIKFLAEGAYNKVSGGHEGEALVALLGGESKAVSFSSSLAATQADVDVWANLCNTYSDSMLYKIPMMRDNFRQSVLPAVFGGSEALLTQWMTWYTKARKEQLNLSRKTFEEFEAFMKQNLADEALRNLVVTWVGAHKVVSIGGAVGRYSPPQIDFFMRIQRLLALRIPIAAGTIKNIGTPSGIGRSAGEPISKGLAGKHAYGVLGTKRDDAGRLYVKLRNPWGDTGRAYTESGGQLTAVETRDAEFYMELWDFHQNFDSIIEGAQAVTAARQAFQRDLAQQLQNQRAALKPISKA